jgi:ubiquinone/menaquinone biosynthesis C-methylase UbiE
MKQLKDIRTYIDSTMRKYTYNNNFAHNYNERRNHHNYENSRKSKFNTFQPDKLDVLIRKIFRFCSAKEQQYIKELIQSSDTDIELKTNLSKISRIVLHYSDLKKDDNRQDFIVSKIMSFLNSTTIDKNSTIVDIGGGNGNVLSGLKTSLGGEKEQYICVETMNDWIESYEFNKTNISYIFWNNNIINIPSESCDLIICMVALHHMTNDTLHTTLQEIHRILKPGGLFMIKEHDCNSTEAQMLINWEHHLYHILDGAYNKEPIHVEPYFEQTVHNFKSKELWKEIIESNQFHFNRRTNRFLDGNYIENESKNPSNLYWDIYEKS